MNNVQQFEFKYGHLACINMVINRQQDTDQMGHVTRGVNKETGRMVNSIMDSLDLENFDATGKKLSEKFVVYSITKNELQWIQDQLNKVFDESKMPIWASRYAFDILDWQMDERKEE